MSDKTDKSETFDHTLGHNGAPLVKEAKLSMECSLEDIYETKGFDHFILTIDHTYAEENILNEAGKVDYRKLKPVPFEIPTYEYLRTGEVIGKCMSFGKE